MARLYLCLFLAAALQGCQSQALAPAQARPVAVLMGYWPPTNEMLRPWSTSPGQNPDGWQGSNWRGLGFDVIAFFPEFPPDGDPTNNAIGELGSVGSQASDLRVDFQDTSADFWRIVDTHQPTVLITTSRGGQIGWELEAVEGGHGEGGDNPAEDWRSDEHGVGLPEKHTVDKRTWQMMSRYRNGHTLKSRLPLQAISAATQTMGDVQIDPNTSGNYLSGFLGLHGLYYATLRDEVQAAGHIHVGGHVEVAHARRLMEASLEATLRSVAP